MRVLAFDPPLERSMGVDGLQGVQFVTMDELLAESDFVCVHAPSLPETHRMFDATLFAQMKKTAFFINTSRGALVNERDLISA